MTVTVAGIAVDTGALPIQRGCDGRRTSAYGCPHHDIAAYQHTNGKGLFRGTPP